MYDTVVIGGGPAGMVAALNVARNNMRCLLLPGVIGGQLLSIARVDNWPGSPLVSGTELAHGFAAHLKGHASTLEIQKSVDVASIEKSADSSFIVTEQNGTARKTRTVILATGAQHRTLGVPGEEQFVGRGVSYCSACDAPYYKNKRVVVVGDTPQATAAANLLLNIAHEVLWLQAGKLNAQNQAAERLVIIREATVTEIQGTDFVKSVTYRDASGQERDIEVEGIFIEMGFTPNSGLVKGLTAFDSQGQIIVDYDTMATSLQGLFAAGDVTNGLYKQIATAVSDGTKAGLSAVRYTQSKSSKEKV